ncbi:MULTISPECIES: hypothetical protein [unclassified Psychrobacter]|uniref:hypothetical protein n=1 Tax=Psychrobacter TaxID=497 RepID=UPI000419927C|nr:MULTISPECIES: hypothetical protein [unclassified Psychrobacter]
MKKTVLNTALSTALLVALGFSVSACSSDKEGGSHEVKAVDRVDEAAKLALANGPEAEEMDFPETAPMPATDMAADGTAVDGATTAEAGADTDMADSADATMTGTDTAATDTSAAPPVADTATTDAEATAN